MYTIDLDGKLLYDPRIQDTLLLNPNLSLEANKHGTLSFTIFPDHPQYGQIRKILSTMTVYRDGKLIYQGRPTYSRRTFRGGVEYKCEELTARLNDVKRRPGTFTGTARDFLVGLLDLYNSKTSAGQSIVIGSILYEADTEITYENDQYIGVWDALQDALPGKLGGYLVPRYELGIIYLDYLGENDLPAASQSIRFGQNLTDLFIETNSDETFSVLIPTGADQEITDDEGETKKVPLTIESVNDGKDFLYSDVGFNLVGWRETYKRWESIEDPVELMETAREYLENEAVRFSESVELTAVDLHNADADVEAFGFLERITAESSVHGLSAVYVLARIVIPLGSPKSSTISLGSTSRTLTDRIVGNATTVRRQETATQNKLNGVENSTATLAQTFSELFGTDSSAILRVGTITRDDVEMNALILKPSWALVVENIDVGAALE